MGQKAIATLPLRQKGSCNASSCKNIIDCALCHNSFESFLFDSGTELYGNMGCQLSKQEIQNQIDFCLLANGQIPNPN